MKVLVVSVFYGKAEYSEQMVESLRKNDAGIDYELLIVNNKANDKETEELLTPKNFKGLNAQAITNNQNKGFSIANNQSMKLIKPETEYYCFLNNDTIVTKNWLKEMVDCMERNEKAVIVGSRLLHPGTGTIQHAGVVELNGHRPHHVYFGRDKDYVPANKEKQYPAVTGACMLVKRDFFESVGGFDEDYWVGWEDIDLCKKATAMGYEIWYAPKSVVYHYEGSSDGRMLAEDANFALYTHRWVLGDKKVKLPTNN